MLEQRGQKRYFYRYEKVGGRSRRIYAGSGAAAEQAAAEDARRQAEKTAQAAAWAETQARLDAADRALDELHEVVGLATQMVLFSAGYHQHARGQWRKRRTPRRSAERPAGSAESATPQDSLVPDETLDGKHTPVREPYVDLAPGLTRTALIMCQRNHPSRPPHWRWERAALLQKHARATPDRQHDDDWIHRACHLHFALFQATDDEQRGAAIEAAGDLGRAYLLWDEVVVPEGAEQPSAAARPERNYARAELEARILTGAPFADIAQALGTSAGAIEAYEAVFFNVRDRLEASTYITHVAIGPGLFDGTGGVESIWKMIAWSTRNQKLLGEIITGCRSLDAAECGSADARAFCVKHAAFVKAITAMLTMRLLPLNEKTCFRLMPRVKKAPLARKDDEAQDDEAAD